MLQFLDSLAAMVTPRSGKAVSTVALEKAAAEAEKAVASAARAIGELEGSLAEAVLKGAAAHAAHRTKTADARAALEAAEAAHAAIKDRLKEAHAEAAEKGRREARERAHTAQQTAAAAILAEYPTARDAILRLQRLVTEADELVAAANADLPAGAEPLPRDVESLVRDIPGQPREVVRSETVELWCGEHGQPIAHQQSVRRTGAETGVIYAPSAFGDRAVQVHLRAFQRQTVRPWAAPTYGARLADLEIPPLRPEASPAAKAIEEFEPVAHPAAAAE